jgi:hypothetical protein
MDHCFATIGLFDETCCDAGQLGGSLNDRLHAQVRVPISPAVTLLSGK